MTLRAATGLGGSTRLFAKAANHPLRTGREPRRGAADDRCAAHPSSSPGTPRSRRCHTSMIAAQDRLVRRPGRWLAALLRGRRPACRRPDRQGGSHVSRLHVRPRGPAGGQKRRGLASPWSLAVWTRAKRSAFSRTRICVCSWRAGGRRRPSANAVALARAGCVRAADRAAGGRSPWDCGSRPTWPPSSGCAAAPWERRRRMPWHGSGTRSAPMAGASASQATRPSARGSRPSRARLPGARVQGGEGWVRADRPDGLPGAADWTHETADGGAQLLLPGPGRARPPGPALVRRRSRLRLREVERTMAAA